MRAIGLNNHHVDWGTYRHGQGRRVAASVFADADDGAVGRNTMYRREQEYSAARRRGSFLTCGCQPQCAGLCGFITAGPRSLAFMNSFACVDKQDRGCRGAIDLGWLGMWERCG